MLKISVRMTLVTIAITGLIYPLVVTGIAQAVFPRQANGERVVQDGRLLGSRLLAQPFTGAGYFHPRPSAVGYDGTNSGGSNLAPTNRALVERVRGDVQRLSAENPGRQIPLDLVTTSASGLDPEISPAGAEFQVPRVARERGISEDAVRALVKKHTRGRWLGIFGEPGVNVLELNLELDAAYPRR